MSSDTLRFDLADHVEEVARAALDETLDQSLRLGGTLRWIVGQTEDAKEGPRAFAEKREAEYKGR